MEMTGIEPTAGFILPGNSTLAYNGVAIRDRGEMLSLTDMWKAAGSPDGRAPNDWRALASSVEFSNHVAEILNAGKSGNDLFSATRGGKHPGTLAHWQIALAYAKYLSPEFHMWCNTVVRERMEGRVVPTPLVLTEEVKRTLGGIFKSVGGSMIDQRLQAFATTILPTAVAGYIAEHSLGIADGLTAGEVCALAKVADRYPRGIAGRVSNRLTIFCARNGEKPRVSRLGRVRAQLFPTHLVREWLDVEGRALIRRWVDERKGQGSLRLVQP